AACPQGTFGLITRIEAGHPPAGDPCLPPPHSPPPAQKSPPRRTVDEARLWRANENSHRSTPLHGQKNENFDGAPPHKAIRETRRVATLRRKKGKERPHVSVAHPVCGAWEKIGRKTACPIQKIILPRRPRRPTGPP